RRHTRWPRDWSSDVCSSDLRPLERQVLAPMNHDTPAERGEPAVGFQSHLALDRILQLGDSFLAAQQALDDWNSRVVRQMVRARSSPVEDELSFPVHDVQVALGNRDRKQPPAD